MNSQPSHTTEKNPPTNIIRDAAGIVSVAGVAIIAVYAIARMVPVWQRNLDSEEIQRSGTKGR